MNLLINTLVRLRLAISLAFWKFLLGSRFESGEAVQIYENVKLAVEAGGKLRAGTGAAFQQGVVVCVKPGARLEIEENVYIGEYCVLMARESISIGRDAMIAPHCTIVDYNH